MAGSQSLKRALVVVALLACTIQLYECFKFRGTKGKTDEEKEHEERVKAAKDAYKRVFVRSGRLTNEEVLEKLKSIEFFYDEPNIDMPIDVRELMSFNATSEEKCDDRDYIQRMRTLVKETKKNYPGLKDYMNNMFERQVQMCDYENRFKRVVEQFKLNEPAKWQLIEEYNYAVSQFGSRMYDWKGKNIDNTYQMNDALTKMFEDKVYRGHYSQHDISYKAYNLARELKEACESFSNRVGASLLMTTLNPKVKQNEEMLEWLRYLNVCGQVERVNYERAISHMFHQQHFPGANELWDSYLNYREMWV